MPTKKQKLNKNTKTKHASTNAQMHAHTILDFILYWLPIPGLGVCHVWSVIMNKRIRESEHPHSPQVFSYFLNN